MKSYTLAEDFRFLFYTLFHPFDGFYELRFRRQRNWILIGLIYALLGFLSILRVYYTGFLVSGTASVYGVNNWFVFGTALFPYFVFALANWSVTTIFNGNGSFSDILQVIAYSIIPKLIFDAFCLILSNFVINEEIMLLYAFNVMGMIFFGFIIFCGLCVIHEYTAVKNILAIAATLIAVVIIVFIAMLYLEVTGKIISFVTTIILEIFRGARI
jgi:hypothetical protein